MPSLITPTALFTVAIILLLAGPAHAFGAGNIASVSKIEGLNWRHGDIEDTLLNLVMSRAAGGKKFTKMMVARVYFGNWLRDYSQAIDVGTVKYVSAEAIRILLWVLGFMTFGYGTKEFEVTTERLGCYRPEDHIDNPKDYADNLDATQYDPRLRAPVNERVELAIDPQTGLKNYIANERAGIMTSALHVRKLFRECIRLGRSYSRSKNENELYEALRLLGTGLHCLEDYSAHSNYTELALIEMGERDVFPHVGSNTRIHLQGARSAVYPIVTGTFGGVDFLHSVMGEVSDKATQSEIQDLEGTMQDGRTADTSVLKDLLAQIPSGIFGGTDEASKADELQQNATTAQMNQMRVSPRRPEEFTLKMQQVSKEIFPIIEWHDEVMKSISKALEDIPILPELIDQLGEQVNIFVFSLLAPFVLPIISQIKSELNTGSSEIIQSSKEKQLIVFHDNNCSDPTHSMLSKDHFSNILNEPAGKIASQVLQWVVPQIIQCMDDERVDVDRTINRIINGVFHHPALRDQGDDGASDGRRLMFGVVENWWREQSEREKQSLRRQLSRDGVMNGENHKEGVHDSGHGCGKPLGMKKQTGGSSGGGKVASGLMGGLSSALGGGSSGFGGSSGGYGKSGIDSGISKFASEAAGGGALGGLVGAFAGGVGGSLLSGAFGGSDETPETKKYSSSGYTQSGGYQKSYTEVGHGGDKYAQAQYTETQLPSGGRQTEYQRFDQSSTGYGAGYEQRTTVHPGGYEQTSERTYGQQRRGSNDGSEGGYKKKSHSKKKDSGDEDSDNGYGKKKYHKKKSEDSDDDKPKRRGSGSYGGGYEKSYKKDSGDEDSDDGYGKKKKYHKKKDDSDDDKPKRRGSGSYGGGYGQPPRQEYQEPPRQEYGGRGEGGYGGGYQQPPPQEYGGRGEGGYGGYQQPPPQEYGGRGEGGYGGYQQPPPQEYGGRGEGGYGGGYQEPPRQYGGGNEAGWGQRERGDDYEERRDDYDDRRDDRREGGGGGWFS